MRRGTFSKPFERYQRHFRRKRMDWFASRFRISANSRIIDLGGTRFNWDLVAVKPQVTMLNIRGDEWAQANLTAKLYDGVTVPFPDGAFDIAYSNSVVEHVGDWSRIENFASEIRRLAPFYYVQTPNKRFPVEVHIMGVMLHWLPFRVARRLVPYLSLWGLTRRPSQKEIDDQLNGVRLLTLEEMCRLFPDAQIRRERFLGLTKSIIAAKLPPG